MFLNVEEKDEIRGSMMLHSCVGVFVCVCVCVCFNEEIEVNSVRTGFSSSSVFVMSFLFYMSGNNVCAHLFARTQFEMLRYIYIFLLFYRTRWRLRCICVCVFFFVRVRLRKNDVNDDHHRNDICIHRTRTPQKSRAKRFELKKKTMSIIIAHWQQRRILYFF